MCIPSSKALGIDVILTRKGIGQLKRLIGIAALWSVFSAAAIGADLIKAEELFKKTDYDASLALLDKKAADGPTNFLLGRNYLMSGDPKKAADVFQKAVAAEAGNSEYMDWLGRAYGRRAETSNPLFAPSLASKARQAFEKAVALNPQNKEALSDLFDYYLEAPGFLGGGYDKAADVAEKMSKIDPPEAFFAKSRLAEKRKDFGIAEQSLRKAVATAPHEVSHVVSLAKFLAKQGRASESDALFAQAEKAAPNAPTVWFARADTLIQQKRNLAEAKSLLQKYMKAPITTDDPPREEAARLMKQVGM